MGVYVPSHPRRSGGFMYPPDIGVSAMSQTAYDRRASHYDPSIDGPTPEELREAFDALRTDDPREEPPLWAIRTLREAGISFPVTVGDRTIRNASITRGDPGHGALSSYDHISRYEVDYLADCPEEDCHSDVTRYRYRAHHNIAGGTATLCPQCKTVHHSENWG